MCLRQKAGAVQIELSATRSSSQCPSCGRLSSRVHSRYWRTISDLPWEGIPVSILLRARKFFCVEARCSRRIFTEQLPGTVARYARRSCRLSEALSSVTLALGGRAGARLARKLGLLVSGSTMLRRFARDRGHLHSLHPESSGSMSGHGRKATDMEPSFVIWSSVESSICCRTVVRRR